MVANFRSAIYICTASSECWQISPASRRPAYDVNSSQVRDMARGKGLTFWTGESFWNDLAPYKQPHNPYHHGEPGNFANITYLWDRILFHIQLFCLTNSVSQRAIASCQALKASMITDMRGGDVAPTEVMNFARDTPAIEPTSTIIEK
eukprot:5790032-Heterocapsa_arctica.AAC.1